MDITCYLAMTANELSTLSRYPAHSAYMACHFSVSSNGISNLPPMLPPRSMLILDDLIPPRDHHPEQILKQLTLLIQTWDIACVLLDFQRPDIPQNQQIVQVLVANLPCPVGVSALYAHGLNCPIFLPPPPLYVSVEKYFQQYTDREIWLELAIESAQIEITQQGSRYFPIPDQPLPSPYFLCKTACSQYHQKLYENHACFTFRRDKEMLLQLIEAGKNFGITQAIGTYQQLTSFP